MTGSEPLSPFPIRADADQEIGYGHFMRCLALGQGIVDRGGEPVFLMARCTEQIERWLDSNDIPLERVTAEPGTDEDVHSTLEYVERMGATRLFLDGYHFDAQYQQSLKKPQLLQFLVDDQAHQVWYEPDFLLNQNVGAKRSMYRGKISHNSRLLLGSRYVLLRRSFRNRTEPPPPTHHRLRRILVTLGGGLHISVLEQILLGILDAVSKDVEVTVVHGRSTPGSRQLEGQFSDSSVNWIYDVEDMAPIMAESDLGVCGAGSTTWEFAFMKVPTVLVALADNQLPNAQAMEDEQAAVVFTDTQSLKCEEISNAVRRLDNDLELRRRMVERSNAMVDGRGVERLISIIRRGRVVC